LRLEKGKSVSPRTEINQTTFFEKVVTECEESGGQREG